VGGDARWQCVPALWRDVLSAGGCCLPAPLVHAVLLAAAAVSLHRVSESAPLQSDMALHASLQWELPRGIDDAAYVNAVGVRHAQQGVAGVDAAVLLDMFRGLMARFVTHVELKLELNEDGGSNAAAAMACLGVLLVSHDVRLVQAAEHALQRRHPHPGGSTPSSSDALHELCKQPELREALLQGLGVVCGA
jgi:hypothetical protein